MDSIDGFLVGTVGWRQSATIHLRGAPFGRIDIMAVADGLHSLMDPFRRGHDRRFLFDPFSHCISACYRHQQRAEAFVIPRCAQLHFPHRSCFHFASRCSSTVFCIFFFLE